MTEFINQDRLRQVAQVVAQPSPLPQGVVLTLQWEVDAQTGRPVSHWVPGVR